MISYKTIHKMANSRSIVLYIYCLMTTFKLILSRSSYQIVMEVTTVKQLGFALNINYQQQKGFLFNCMENEYL